MPRAADANDAAAADANDAAAADANVAANADANGAAKADANGSDDAASGCRLRDGIRRRTTAGLRAWDVLWTSAGVRLSNISIAIIMVIITITTSEKCAVT